MCGQQGIGLPTQQFPIHPRQPQMTAAVQLCSPWLATCIAGPVPAWGAQMCTWAHAGLTHHWRKALPWNRAAISNPTATEFSLCFPVTSLCATHGKEGKTDSILTVCLEEFIFFNPFFTKTYFHLRMLQSVAKLSSGRIVAGCPRLSAVQNQAVHQQSIYRARLSQGRSVLYNSADGSVCYWKYIVGALTRTLCSSAVSSSTMAPKVEWGMQAIFIKSLLLLILVSFFS